MANRRADLVMSEEEVADLLVAGRVMILVTLGPDGMPDPVPMWYVVDPDGVPAMKTYAASQKVLNLRRDGRAVALLEDGERYRELRGAQFSGRVELVDDPEVVADVVARLAIKYEGVPAEQFAAVREAAMQRITRPTGRQVVLRLLADRVVSWDHRKLTPPA